MSRLLLDTGILVHYVRNSLLYKTIEVSENLSSQETTSFISVVTMGEILSFAKQRKWGFAKLQLLEDLFRELIILDINSDDEQLLEVYAEIDTWSKN
jgi:tRNA(fMet)-specific endonuclease VapC